MESDAWINRVKPGVWEGDGPVCLCSQSNGNTGPSDAPSPGAWLPWGRKVRLGFGPRLALALGLTLALMMGVGYVEVTRVLERHVIEHESVYQRAQAKALEAVARGETPAIANDLLLPVRPA